MITNTLELERKINNLQNQAGTQNQVNPIHNDDIIKMYNEIKGNIPKITQGIYCLLYFSNKYAIDFQAFGQNILWLNGEVPQLNRDIKKIWKNLNEKFNLKIIQEDSQRYELLEDLEKLRGYCSALDDITRRKMRAKIPQIKYTY